MARCNCSGSTCSCKLQEGNGIAISGSGSTTDPYVIDATGNIEGTVRFISTPTVEFNVTGQGSSASPFQVQANAVVDMAELADVQDPTGPQEGEVPVWTTDHWEFKTPASAPPGAVNVGQGLTGDGSAGAPLTASVSGIWGQGSMLTPPWPTDSTVGVPIYVDSNGQLRAKPYAMTYITNAQVPAVAVVSGWSLVSSVMGRWGGVCFVSARLKRTGSAIGGSASGNISSVKVGTLAAQAPPVFSGGSAVAVSGDVGGICGVSLYADRTINLTNLVPNVTFAQNGEFNFTCLYLTQMEVRLPDGTLSPV